MKTRVISNDALISLRTALAEFILIRQAYPPMDLQKKTIRESPFQWRTVVEPYFGINSWMAFNQNTEYQSIANSLDNKLRKQEPALLGHLNTGGMQWQIMDSKMLLASLYSRYETLINERIAPDAAINQVMEDLRLVFNTQKVIENTLMPLNGFQIPEDINVIDLDSETSIVRLNDDQFKFLYYHDMYSGPRENPDLGLAQVALVIKNEVDFSLTEIRESNPVLITTYELVEAKVQNFLSAIHILKSGHLHISRKYQMLEPNVFPGMRGSSSGFSGTRLPSFLEINESEISKLKAIIKNLTTTPHGAVRIASRRLTTAENRFTPVDALIDAAIGLEILLNPNDSSELAFRVALNYAYLAPEAERRKRFDTLSAVQASRNKVVHGSIKFQNSANEEVASHAATAKECLRDAIGRFLTDPSLCNSPKLDRDFWLNRIIPEMVVPMKQTLKE